jgi:hypothetical protein
METGEWKILQNEYVYGLYSRTNIIRVIELRRMRWTGHVAGMGDRRVAYNILVNSEQKRSLGRPRRRWEHSIKLDLEEVE